MLLEQVENIIANGTVHVNHSMDCIDVQLAKNNQFYYEHPGTATSWKLPRVRETSSREGVLTVVFHQRMTGLKTPVTAAPMRKRTRVITNALEVLRGLADKRCNRRHGHRPTKGSEGGYKLSKWAQVYTPELCCILVASCGH